MFLNLKKLKFVFSLRLHVTIFSPMWIRRWSAEYYQNVWSNPCQHGVSPSISRPLSDSDVHRTFEHVRHSKLLDLKTRLVCYKGSVVDATEYPTHLPRRFYRASTTTFQTMRKQMWGQVRTADWRQCVSWVGPAARKRPATEFVRTDRNCVVCTWNCVCACVMCVSGNFYLYHHIGDPTNRRPRSAAN
jgi:hypothetical protein